jgi:cobalt-zinc-cadmium resistance protein CzcA
VRGRDLGSTVEEAIDRVDKQVSLPTGYHLAWAGEYESKQRADKRLAIIVPLTILWIFIILYMMFKSFKWATLILINVALARVGGLLALLVTHTNISVSSSVGFLALFGVSVQTGVIMLEYINQLRARGHAKFPCRGRRAGSGHCLYTRPCTGILRKASEISGLI